MSFHASPGISWPELTGAGREPRTRRGRESSERTLLFLHWATAKGRVRESGECPELFSLCSVFPPLSPVPASRESAAGRRLGRHLELQNLKSFSLIRKTVVPRMRGHPRSFSLTLTSCHLVLEADRGRKSIAEPGTKAQALWPWEGEGELESGEVGGGGNSRKRPMMWQRNS